MRIPLLHALLALLLALTGCPQPPGGDDDVGDDDDNGDDDDDDDTPPLVCDGFEDDATVWTLPAYFPANTEVLDDLAHDDDVGCNSSQSLTFSLLDLTGDGDPDLVLTDKCDTEGVGTDEWHVYPNTGSGFDDEATVWSLPKYFPANTEVLDDLAHDDDVGCNSSQSLTFSLLDLTGDGDPDLVLTDKCDTEGVGTDEWHVYENNGDGFDDDASVWSLPAYFPANTEVLDDLAHDDDTGCNSSQQLTFSLLDLTGDGALDLVLTDKCDAEGVGTDEWHIYPNTGSGFDDEATVWSLPKYFPANTEVLDDLAHDDDTGCNSSQQLTFSLLDLTGDGALDLVLTDKCDDDGVGTDEWHVYENNGDGFDDDASVWSLPAYFPANAEVLDDLAHDDDHGCTSSQKMTFSLLDLTGDDNLTQ